MKGMAGPDRPTKCRRCKHWYYVKPFRGNCRLHPWEEDQWSESASPASKGCQDYEEYWMGRTEP